MTLRQVHAYEMEMFEWIDVSEVGSDKIVVLKGLRKVSIPPVPDQDFAYRLVETTKVSDEVRSYEWVPIMTEE